ncbi:MAG TPA: PAS domain-containing protein, partial [Reyranella sp.]|nr:PAS domain-containing protein [Reyranella sp.]
MPGVDPLPGGTDGRASVTPVKRAAARPFRVPLVLAGLAIGTRPTSAQVLIGGGQLGTLEVIQLAMFVGVMGAALLSAIWLIRERARTAAENVELRTRVAELGSALRRTEALLNLNDQRFVVWSPDDEKSSILGELPDDSGAPEERSAFLAFGRWLMPASASALERAVTALRGSGTGFEIVVETRSGSLLEVQGRKAALHAVARFTALSEKQREHARLRLDHQQLSQAYQAMLGLLDALPAPFWLRDGEGRLSWVNNAFAAAAGAASREIVLDAGSEFLPTSAREEIARSQVAAPVYAETVSTVVDGDRRVFAVTDMRGTGAAAGIAIDISDVDALRREHESTVRSHADTLDQLTTAVAIFDENQKLRFFNQAFQKLWDL